MRSRFDEQLETLHREMIEMGALCEKAIGMAGASLEEGNKERAKEVVKMDHEIDHKEKEIETLCLKMLLRQQPVARDLRQISAALKMITDMERIGDQAADIAEITRHLNGHKPNEFAEIGKMVTAVTKMVTDSIDAYVKQDLSLAEEVIKYDDIVDQLFCEVKEAMIVLIQTESEKGEFALDLLMIAKYLERIGDHATNIAEWVGFAVTGVHKEEENDLVCGG